MLQARVHHFYHYITGHNYWEAACNTGRLKIPAASTWRDLDFLPPIIPLLTRIGLCHSLVDTLTACGYFAIGGGFPVVPAGKERVRVIIHADHTESQIEGLADAVVKWAVSSTMPKL